MAIQHNKEGTAEFLVCGNPACRQDQGRPPEEGGREVWGENCRKRWRWTSVEGGHREQGRHFEKNE
jgi:hypothetical protein